MAKVILEKVCKVYPGSVTAVSDVNLEIADREFVVLVGPSGCGKSTTLRMVAGLEEVSSGSIYIDDRKVNDVPPKDRDIAMVFQNYALYPHMTVRENLAFGLKLRKMPRADIEQRVGEAADILGIADLLERKPKALSGGQRQRVAVGRAIVRKPKAFLFDEPLSNLDAKMRVQMRMEISRLHTRLACTMIYVTHDQIEAMTMGDRIVVMKDGVVQQTDRPMTIYSQPANRFVAGFIGSPPMNFFDGRLENRDGRMFFNAGTFSVCAEDSQYARLAEHDGKKITMGLRPEDLKDALYAPQASADHSVPAGVEVVEPMGAEVYLYLNNGPHNFTARTDAHDPATAGQSITMVFNMKKAHFFDAETGRTIL
ncbi:MAG TPA: sn-glycerol-3-phosphate ABC transporter ATP-binding protein UgpC [Kiritimatiellia bacterium]|nr:sn-glycerol-3-phosphate ABC transporter ATP-binding protein UgpC [Kiritimatiellia bacterium]